MTRLACPPDNIRSVHSSVALARAFHAQRGTLPLYEHGHSVLGTTLKSGIVESKVISDPKQPLERRCANSALAELSLWHMIDHDKLQNYGGTLPKVLTTPDVREELTRFSRMSKAIKTGDTGAFKKELDNGNAHLALLVMLADYAQVSTNYDIRLNEMLGMSDPLFRTYADRKELLGCLTHGAELAEDKLAPLAELFGYPGIAGDIIQHAYEIRHPETHSHIIGLFTDSQICEMICATQKIVRKIRRRLVDTLRANGFEATVEMRPIKHPGKVMRKIHRFVLNSMNRDARLDYLDGKTSGLDGYLQILKSFDLRNVNDPIALKVILHSLHGQPVDEMDSVSDNFGGGEVVSLMKQVIDVAVSHVRTVLTTFNAVLRIESRYDQVYYMDYTHYSKDNGYDAHHFDSRPAMPDATILPFEVQVKTQGQDYVASHGGAAHYLYLGGDSTFVVNMRARYLETVHGLTNGNGTKY